MFIRWYGQTDGRRNDFDTKLINPFFTKEKQNGYNEWVLLLVSRWLITSIVLHCSIQFLFSGALCLTMECRDCSEASCPPGYQCYEAHYRQPGCYGSPLQQPSMSRAEPQRDLEIFRCIWLHLNLLVFSNLYSPLPHTDVLKRFCKQSRPTSGSKSCLIRDYSVSSWKYIWSYTISRRHDKYTMHNKFSNVLCFTSFCAHLCAISNNFNCNDENRILGKWNHEFTYAIL